METPPDHGLSLSVSWHSGAKRRSYSVSAGSLLRIAAVLALCALSYRVGVWHARLERDAAVAAAAPLLPNAAALSDGGSGARAPGAAPGAAQDVITPLNVRDPSALVMGPSPDPLPEPVVAAPPPMPRELTDESWKEALKEATSKALKSATKAEKAAPR